MLPGIARLYEEAGGALMLVDSGEGLPGIKIGNESIEEAYRRK